VNAGPAAPPVVCYRHAERETALHCTQCERPTCGRCARPAAVGQLCPDCARLWRPVNYQVGARQIVVAALVVLALACAAAIGALLLEQALFGFYVALFGGPARRPLL
jgi:hypothetical protein